MSKRRMIVALSCVATLTLATGFVVVRSFPLKATGLPPAVANPTNTTDKVFKVGNGVSAPVPIYKPDPPYTKKARADKIQGMVSLLVTIGTDGDVKDVEITKSLDPGLDQSAVDTIRTWKFKPAMKAGKAVACKVKVEVAFKLF